MSIIALALAVFKAIPIIDSWFQSLMVAYVKERSATMLAENRDALAEMFSKNDQRPVERLLNPSGAGEPSGIPGTEIRDRLPGVDS